MLIERIWTGNSGRNFNYLLACPATGEALAIDPLDHQGCLAAAAARGWRIAQIVNTHEHADHTGGNRALVAKTGARLLAHRGATARIAGVDRGLVQGDRIAVGRTVRLDVLDTPGHTLAHICLLAQGAEPALFAGDTLFNAGVGNCRHGGDPAALYRTCALSIAALDDATRLYPGHDYFERNLAFALDREPDNPHAAELLARVAGRAGAEAPVATLGEERRYNPFLRLGSRSLIARLREAVATLPAEPEGRTVFLHLRELRDRW